MSLKVYKAKRDFTKTREPKAKQEKRSAHRFVVQEHHASHLHYDFRLELDGVLKSWAVPKGPSLDPKEKRLAVEVEDHPVSYRDFEGEIPKGEYGAGHVIVWDRGEWKPLSTHPLADLKKGRIEFELSGEKLHGKWILVRTRGKESKSWLLLKRHDKFAKDGSNDSIVKNRPESVITGKTVDDLKSRAPAKKSAKKTTERKSASPPPFRAPQLALLQEAPPKGDNWVHEIKYDGYRTQCRIEDGKVRFFTRSGLDWTKKYGSLADICSELKVKSAVLDGEIVCLDPQGRSDFSQLQKALKAGQTDRLIYYVFDLLFLNGEDVSERPLLERKSLLKDIIESSPSGRILYSEHWKANGASVLQKSCAFNLEGIISKRSDLGYESGRTGTWTKSKCGYNQEFVIVGFTKPEGARTGFGALLLAAKDENGKLRYVGKVGTGFDSQSLSSIAKKLKPLLTDEPAVEGKIPGARSATWVEPELVAQLKFGAWTDDGILRHAVFLGLREDKPASTVEVDRPKRSVAAARELAVATKETPIEKTPLRTKKKPTRISHGERLVFPGTKITKADLAEYYVTNSSRILEHISERPLSVLRCPEGAGGECFFQKHAADLGQVDIKRAQVALKERDKKSDDILFVDSAEGLLALAQMGVIELHTWGCHRDKVERPDLIVFDLDPDPGVSWAQMIEGAHAIKETLDHLKLKSFLKVTGGKGLHLHVPIARRYTWDQVKSFSKVVVANLAQQEPKLYTTNITKAKRKGRIFLDYLRNGYGATAVAPYSVRARKGAPVALPVKWSDLTKDLKPDEFSLTDVADVLRRQKTDPWKGYFDLSQAISILEE